MNVELTTRDRDKETAPSLFSRTYLPCSLISVLGSSRGPCASKSTSRVSWKESLHMVMVCLCVCMQTHVHIPEVPYPGEQRDDISSIRVITDQV